MNRHMNHSDVPDIINSPCAARGESEGEIKRDMMEDRNKEISWGP